MDRRGGYMLSLKHVCSLINSLGFQKVRIMEAHSDVTTALLDNVENVNGTELLLFRALKDGFIDPIDSMLLPDAGAAKRYDRVLNVPTYTAQKHRDFTSGKLASMEVMTQDDLEGQHIVILDDLCSAGGTFQWAASILKEEYGVRKVTLIVAHCEPTVLDGLSRDSNQLDLIVTTDSIIDYKDVSNRPEVYIYNSSKVML